MKFLAAILLLPSLAFGNRVISEGIAASNNAIYIDTTVPTITTVGPFNVGTSVTLGSMTVYGNKGVMLYPGGQEQHGLHLWGTNGGSSFETGNFVEMHKGIGLNPLQGVLNVNGGGGGRIHLDGDTRTRNSWIGESSGNTGYLGVSNSSPAYTLDVGGDVNFTGILRQNGSPFVSVAAATISVNWVHDDFLSQVNGSNTVFTLSQTVSSGTAVGVYRDGLKMAYGTDWTFSSNAVNMVTAPASNTSSFYADYTVNTTTQPGVINSGSSAGGDLSGTYPNPTTVGISSSCASGQFVDAAHVTRGRLDGGVCTSAGSGDVTQSGNNTLTGLNKFTGTGTNGVVLSSASANGVNFLGSWSDWTPSWTGCSANQTGNFRFIQVGKTVCVQIGITGNCTSSATTFTMTLPVAATSSGASNVCQAIQTKDNGTWGNGEGCFSNSSTTFTLYKDVNQTAFTASGNKAVFGGFCYEAN